MNNIFQQVNTSGRGVMEDLKSLKFIFNIYLITYIYHFYNNICHNNLSYNILNEIGQESKMVRCACLVKLINPVSSNPTKWSNTLCGVNA